MSNWKTVEYDREIRKKCVQISESLGIKPKRCHQTGCMDGEFAYPSSKGLCPTCHGTSYYPPLKDYFNDLNACAEMEKGLEGDPSDGGSEIYKYSHTIYNIVVPIGMQPFRATAEQRAEAFGVVKGLWKKS